MILIHQKNIIALVLLFTLQTTATTVRFHPTSQVVMTAGKDNTLSFFQVSAYCTYQTEGLVVCN